MADTETVEMRLAEILALPDLTVWPTLRVTCADALVVIRELREENEALRLERAVREMNDG